MGDLVSLDTFRDRRDLKSSTISGAMDPTLMTNAELHAHLRTTHKWGGPKSAKKDRLLSAHQNSHDFPVGIETPHSHGS